MNIVSVCGPTDIDGGKISYLTSSVGSQVDISGGSVSYVLPRDFSQVDISGGTITWIYGVWSSQVNISGGTIGVYGGFRPDAQSIIKIFGSDFTVDGQTVGYGELTSIFGGSYNDEPMRHLTGTLASGELINSVFYIGHDAKITLVPEPATLLLLGLATVMVRKRR
jgi:hypothetical protein